MILKHIELDHRVDSWLAIEEERFHVAIGGIRLATGSTSREAELLARAMSYKLHTFGFPMSGAKTVIDSDRIDSFNSFINHPDVRDMLLGKDDIQLIAGPDIGTSETAYYKALELAGLSELTRPGLLSQISEDYHLPMDNIVTALGVVVACEEVVRMRKFGDPLEDLRISIEGFGKVGTGIARLIHGRAKLVAVSTRYGTIAEPEGFDIKRLLQLQSQYGDHFIDHVDSEIMATERLFSIPTDIIIPGARTEVVTEEIAREIIKIRPRAIVPVSNYPYTKEALDIFHHSGILAFPDFIASAGAIIAGMVEFAQAGGQKEALDLVHVAITTETRQILMAAKACTDYSKSMYAIAIDRAISDKQRLLEDTKSMSIHKIATDFIQRYLPDLLKS